MNWTIVSPLHFYLTQDGLINIDLFKIYYSSNDQVVYGIYLHSKSQHKTFTSKCWSVHLFVLLSLTKVRPLQVTRYTQLCEGNKQL